MKTFRANGIEPGLELHRFFPEMTDCLLIAVTETKSKEQLDRFAEIAARSLS
jgi:glycine dehydrogenase subunit 1